MSSDGKVDRLRRQLRHLEARRRDRPDERDQARHRHATRRTTRSRSRRSRNEVDAFDLSPSGRRAVISARGQILTIATDRGDITRVAPDKMASRNQSPKWSPDGKYVAFVSDRSGRDEIWISDPEGTDAEEDHRSRQREGRARVDAGLEARCSTPPPTRSCTATRVADGKTAVVASSDVGAHRLGRGLARQQVGRVLEAGSHAALARLHRADRRRRGAPPLRRQRCSTPRPTRSGPPTAATSCSRRPKASSNGIASQGGISDDDGAVGDVAARSGSRSDESRHRQRGAGARRRSGGAADAGAAAARAPRRPSRSGSTGAASRAARASSRCRARRSAG